MSELIDNRQHRQEILKNIIRDLHAGVDSEEIKERFGDLLDQVGPTEIAEIEQSLINEGLAVEEIQKLCDVHVAVFKDSLDKQKAAELVQKEMDEDPLLSMRKENQQINQLIEDIRKLVEEIGEAKGFSDIDKPLETWLSKHKQLLTVDQHYSKKENILFPYLERYSISGPPSVMWGIHDEIRASLKEITELLNTISGKITIPQLAVKISNLVLPTLNAISEMVYKEENILFPMCRDTLSLEEWKEIKAQFKDPFAAVYKDKNESDGQQNLQNIEGIDLDIGVLTPEQINLVLTHLPVDITYVDEKDEVRFFSLGPERIFERTRAIIGRKVQFCHPPNSMGIVEKILDDFKSGRKDNADFWINMNGQMIYIRYFAVRDEDGDYKGTIEVTQNITEIKSLTGEKRIYDYSK